MPIDYKNYPSNWKTEIRPAILIRDNNCCNFCGLQNHSIGYRDEIGWHDIEQSFAGDMDAESNGFKVIQIVLTIAHLDHNTKNNDYSNLAALCQKCHNNYDIKNRIHNRLNPKHQRSMF